MALFLSTTHYIRKHNKRIWENFIGIIFLFWMRLIVLESAKILRDPEITLTLFSPLIYYTVAGVTTTVIIIVFVYRKYGRDFFTNPLGRDN